MGTGKFLPRDALHKRATGRRPVSVRLSVTLMYCVQTAIDIMKLFLGQVDHPIT